VLEELWLTDRHGRLGDFYKGLIQLTGAFVHVQKKRQGPAAALFKLAELNLAKYAPTHEHLDVTAVLSLIRVWQGHLERRDDRDLVLTADSAPRIVPAESAYSAPDSLLRRATAQFHDDLRDGLRARFGSLIALPCNGR